MHKYYEVGDHKFEIETITSKYVLTVKDPDGSTIKFRFDTMAGAMLEILSYAEISADDYDE